MPRMDVEAELELSIAHVRLVQLDHPGLSENLFARPDVYWVDGCLTPRRPNARARYVSEWGPHRFGGMGSIIGSIVTGLVLGLVEGLTRVFYPEASNIVVFVIMAIVLMIRPNGLFGRAR